jgi:hypothetical protein
VHFVTAENMLFQATIYCGSTNSTMSTLTLIKNGMMSDVLNARNVFHSAQSHSKTSPKKKQ